MNLISAQGVEFQLLSFFLHIAAFTYVNQCHEGNQSIRQTPPPDLKSLATFTHAQYSIRILTHQWTWFCVYL